MITWPTDAIMVSDGAFAEPQAVVDTLNKLALWEPVKLYDGKAENRTCMQTPISKLSKHNHAELTEIDKLVYASFAQALTAYTKENEYLRISSDEGYTALRYEVGQLCSMHSDARLPIDELHRSRVISGIIYLSDCDGGDLVFPRQKVTVKCAAGRVVLFPSCFAFPHESTPVLKGTKYAVLTWFGVL